jgi:Domain of unknown function (DUF4386)
LNIEAKRSARIAGLLYFAAAAIAAATFLFEPRKLIDQTTFIGAAERVIAAQWTIRFDILFESVYQVIEVFLALVLYKLFYSTSATLSRQMMVLALISVPIALINLMNLVGALIFAGHQPIAGAFNPQQLDTIVGTLIQMHSQGLKIAGIFWGLWLIPFGLLIIRCRFIPKVFGICSIIGGFGYLCDSTASLVLPSFLSPHSVATVRWLGELLEMGELPSILWLLIVGARKID